MKHVEFVKSTHLRVDGIAGFMRRAVTKFGTGAKVDCPKEYLGKRVYLVVLEDESGTSIKGNNQTERRKQRIKKNL
jgi:putative transposon-encoded protein